MKKQVFLFLSITFILAFTAFSCREKETISISPTETNDKLSSAPQSSGTNIILQLDGKVVPSGSFSVDDPSLSIVLEQYDDNTLIVHGFTSEEKYLDFGDSNGYNLRLALEIEKYLSSYAESSGVITETEATGIVPTWWVNFVDTYLSSKLRNKTISSRGISTELYTGFDGLGRHISTLPSFTGLGNYAFLSNWGMNDNISSFHPSSLVSSVDIAFDKSFFRQRMFTKVTNPRTLNVFALNFDGVNAGFDNRASSWITGGF